MTGRTHTAVGCATALGIAAMAMPAIQPIDIATILGSAAMAGTLPDVDVGSAKKTYKYVTYGMAAAILGLVYLMRVAGVGITGAPTELIGIILFGALMIFSSRQPHRGFTHSLLALALFSISFYIIVRGLHLGVLATAGFTISYAAHLGLDVLNTKGCQYLYPMPQRFCTKLCKASGACNKALELTGDFLVAFELMYLCLRGSL